MDADELAQSRICSGCVGEPFLKAEVDEKGEDAECSYCEETGKTTLAAEYRITPMF